MTKPAADQDDLSTQRAALEAQRGDLLADVAAGRKSAVDILDDIKAIEASLHAIAQVQPAVADRFERDQAAREAADWHRMLDEELAPSFARAVHIGAQIEAALERLAALRRELHAALEWGWIRRTASEPLQRSLRAIARDGQTLDDILADRLRESRVLVDGQTVAALDRGRRMDQFLAAWTSKFVDVARGMGPPRPADRPDV